MAAKDEETNFDDLEAYESEDEEVQEQGDKQEQKKDQDIYASVHAAGFRDFMLKPELLRAIGDCSFEHPSEVQNACIPQAILGTDIICQAKSGMGKTAVFVLSVLQQVSPVDGEVARVVLAHTRELAYQIKSEFDRFKKYMPAVKADVFFGGMPITTDREKLKKDAPHIVIGTPGRMLALANERVLKLDKVKYFVVDECDQMLESLDMRGDVQKIFRFTPVDKQVMMFSATLSDEMRTLCKKFMHSPLEIYVAEGAKLTLHGLLQYYVELQESEKNRKLVELLDTLEFNQIVIFVKSVARASELNKLLADLAFPSICIHAGLKQAERIARYSRFKDFQSRVMVATNLFGRGIDIERVNVVINYDMPENADTYLHRVGRAGRFGTKGLAVSFVSSKEDAEVLNDVQSRFVVNVPKLPEKIDSDKYMTS